jgi:methylated-DNA-[protein]-cysteine S-methyltransferase
MTTTTTEDSIRYSLDKSEDVICAVFLSELGWIALAVRDETLCGLVFGHATAEKSSAALVRAVGFREQLNRKRISDRRSSVSPAAARLVDELQRFAGGEPIEFRGVAISEAHLTPFGRRIVAACRRIPFGQTRSYGQLAAACGSPGAARAVGQVMAKNRYPLVVPCHRVLAAGGQVGGFSAPQGLAMKRRLLSLEGADV